MLKKILLIAITALLAQNASALTTSTIGPSFRVIDNINTSQVSGANGLTGAINLIATDGRGFVQNNHTNIAPYAGQTSMNVAEIKVNVSGIPGYSNYQDYSQMAPSCLGVIPSSGTLEILGTISQKNGVNKLKSLSCIKQKLL